ncbi:MAG: hypothetical protein WC707_05585 [Candidatus Babeliaceae bacterium]|jgi:hypothetical protein
MKIFYNTLIASILVATSLQAHNKAVGFAYIMRQFEDGSRSHENKIQATRDSLTKTRAILDKERTTWTNKNKKFKFDKTTAIAPLKTYTGLALITFGTKKSINTIISIPSLCNIAYNASRTDPNSTYQTITTVGLVFCGATAISFCYLYCGINMARQGLEDMRRGIDYPNYLTKEIAKIDEQQLELATQAPAS